MGAACMQGYEEAGTDLAQLLTQKETMARKKAAMPAGVSKALARLTSGLYVVTAATQGARGAMVASWVAQASFEPLGITVAVAKDRAIESLLQVSCSTAVGAPITIVGREHATGNCAGRQAFHAHLHHAPSAVLYIFAATKSKSYCQQLVCNLHAPLSMQSWAHGVMLTLPAYRWATPLCSTAWATRMQRPS